MIDTIWYLRCHNLVDLRLSWKGCLGVHYVNVHVSIQQTPSDCDEQSHHGMSPLVAFEESLYIEKMNNAARLLSGDICR